MTQCCCWVAASGRPGGTRDRHDRGLLALSQGPDRAGVGDVPGPAGVRAAAGTGDRPGQRERHPAGLPAPLQPALRRARRERDPRPRGRYRRGSISPGCVRSAGVGPSTSDSCVRLHGMVLQLPPGPGGRSLAGRRVELELRLDGRRASAAGARQVTRGQGPSVRRPVTGAEQPQRRQSSGRRSSVAEDQSRIQARQGTSRGSTIDRFTEQLSCQSQ